MWETFGIDIADYLGPEQLAKLAAAVERGEPFNPELVWSIIRILVLPA